MTDLLHLARKKGTNREFLLWLRTQPSALSGAMDYDPNTGLWFCDPCHYRTAKNSGIGIKPDYSAIPLTHTEHLKQHCIGQYNFMPRSWWEQQCPKHLKRWIES